MVFSCFSCSLSHSSNYPGSEDIGISWEVLSNTFGDDARVKAVFTIVNNSSYTLAEDNWQLYFNKSPRIILDDGSESGIRVEHISGDWHRLVPLEGFQLLPGEQINVVYEARFWWIKETDAPKGLYFVFKEDDGTENIVTVADFEIRPFERKEQLTRHNRDVEPIPGPEWRWNQNKEMYEVDTGELLPLVPSPLKLEMKGESVSFNSRDLFYSDPLLFEANYLKEQVEKLTGKDISLHNAEVFGSGFISVSINENLSVNGKATEAYELTINAEGNVIITGADKAGVFYGIQSFLALFDPQDYFQQQEFSLPVLAVEDAPRFDYRGVHLDVARNFQDKQTVLRMIDLLAFYKINTLHLHLTDDEGWRIEIPSLPELTEVGAQRGHTSREASALHPSFGSGPHAYADNQFGSGYYSREDFIEILRYARQKHIRVIPEINMPGHARAAIKAMEARYDRLMEAGDEQAAEQFRLIDPEETSQYLSAQLFTDNVVNVARESVYHFFEIVVDEVIEMYRAADAPLEMLHVGGDEVPSGSWTASPMIDAKMEQLPHISKPANMHAYFTQRVLEILSERNLIMAGWEEVALMEDGDGKNIPNTNFADGRVIPFVWNNLWGAQDLAYRLANTGFPVILSHVTAFYFDLAYNKDPKEPGLYWGGFVNTRSAWHYSPYDVFSTTLKDNMGNTIDVKNEYKHMQRLNPAARDNILGVQAQLWSETIKGAEMLDYYLLPKLIGFAESAWAPQRNWEVAPDHERRAEQVEKQWNVFANSLARKELPRLSYLFGGYNYRIPLPGAVLEDGVLQANSEFPGLIIRYTTDGSEPHKNSDRYKEPLDVGQSTVNVRLFDLSGNGGRTVTLNP